MALKTLDEVIILILNIYTVPTKELKHKIRGELRDFFAHEVMRYEAKLSKSLSNDLKVLGAQELFDRIFGGKS